MSIRKQFRNCSSLLAGRSALVGATLLAGLLAGAPALAQAPGGRPVAIVTGALSTEVVRKTIRPYLDEVRHCVDFSLASELQLGGQVTVNFKIASSGAVVSARIKPSPLRDHEIEQCILTRIKTWAFPKQPAGVTRVTYHFELFSTEDKVTMQ